MKKFLEVSSLFIALISVAAACGGDSHTDDPGDTCPSTLPECSKSGGTPCRDPESSHSKFGDIEWFWSSSLLSDNLGMAWLVGFDFGFVGNSTIEDMGFHYVRCVR